MANDIRVLAFTASQHRPLMLRHCIFQIQQQRHAVSHGIYLNSNEFSSDADTTNYASLIADIKVNKPLNLAYGPSSHQHMNHFAAIQQFNIDDFDLFLKIDDDDIYLNDYVEKVVEDFKSRQWDFSATTSSGFINGKKYDSKQHTYLHKVDVDGKEAFFTSGTYAFSRKAIRFLKEKGGTWDWNNKYEDREWGVWLLENPEIKVLARPEQGYIYNVHGRNFSTHHLLEE